MNKLFFSKKNFFSSKKLSISLINMNEWVIVSVYGKDSKKYLQNQFTCNIYSIVKNKYIHCSHCNIYGKVLTNLYLYYYKKKFFYIIRKNILSFHIQELKKYSIFSKVNILHKKKMLLFGFVGRNIKLFLLKFFKFLPDKKNKIIYYKKITIFWFKKPKERFLFIIHYSQIKFFKKIFNIFSIVNSNQWMALEMESNVPIIDIYNINKFFIQSLNLKIDKKKGCYLGQEAITKIKFKKLNNKYLYLLQCLNEKNIFKYLTDEIIFKNFENKIIYGKILSIVNIDKKFIWIQIILNKKFFIYDNLILYKNKKIKFLVIK
ncbi:tRNA-modifying protein YgfZ [Buchnera aphidicola]|uniref:tRNA-modifying protein YgfZ n=1 Tax=Buchnera aphidicola TaxID=9 RepID=UPI0031B813A5